MSPSSVIKLGAKCPCDLDVLVNTRLLVQANSGAGKSWALRRLLEQSHGKVQQLVIDPEGEFATLREHYDYIYGAKHEGDTAVDPRAAKLLAERLLELGVSAVLDIYELKAKERVVFVRRFLEALVDAPKRLWHPVLVVVDEAHVYCPQRGEAESASAVIDLCTRGRKRGFCAILATQRLSKLHKDAAAELNNKLIGRTGLDVDVKRAAEELGFTSKEDQHQLRRMQPGDFFAFGPALSAEVTRVHVGAVRTTHPKAGERIAFAPPPPTAKVKKLLPQLADLPAEAEAKARTVADLQAAVRERDRRIKQLEREAPAPEVERVEVPVFQNGEVKELGEIAGLLATYATDLQAAAALGPQLTAAAQTIRVALNGRHTNTTPAPRRSIVRRDAMAPRPPRAQATRATDPDGVSRPEQRILNELAELEALGIAKPDKVQLGFFCGYTNVRSGGFSEPMGRLVKAGLAHYPDRGRVALTDDGRAVAEPPGAVSTTEDLQARIIARLDGPRSRILGELIGIYPDSIDKEELGARLGYTNVRSGGFSEPLGSLRSLGMIDYPERGRVVALPVLFLEEATA